MLLPPVLIHLMASTRPPSPPEDQAHFPENGWEAHFNPEHLRTMLSLHALPHEEQIRLFYHLPCGCPRCWQALRQVGPPPMDAPPAEDPALQALRLVTTPRLLGLSPTQKRLVSQIRQRPEGFAHLVFDLHDRHWPQLRTIAKVPSYRTIPELAVLGHIAATQLRAPQTRDIQGRYHLTLATEQRLRGHISSALFEVDTATHQLDRGTGDGVLAALRQRVLADCLWQDNRRPQAILELVTAFNTLRGIEFLEHRLEIFADLGEMLLCTGNYETAAFHLRHAWQLMTEYAPGLDPEVAEKLRYHLAVARGEMPPLARWHLSDEAIADKELLLKIDSQAHRELVEREEIQ